MTNVNDALWFQWSLENFKLCNLKTTCIEKILGRLLGDLGPYQISMTVMMSIVEVVAKKRTSQILWRSILHLGCFQSCFRHSYAWSLVLAVTIFMPWYHLLHCTVGTMWGLKFYWPNGIWIRPALSWNTRLTLPKFTVSAIICLCDWFFFLSGFSFTNIHDSRDSKGRGRVSI